MLRSLRACRSGQAEGHWSDDGTQSIPESAHPSDRWDRAVAASDGAFRVPARSRRRYRAVGGRTSRSEAARADPLEWRGLPAFHRATDGGGAALSELRTEVRQRLPDKPIRRRTLQGLEVVVVDPDDIVLAIAEYRPIYVNGDVARPGEQPYRLGMTVRQAVALSGGYDLIRFRADANPIAQSADLRSEYLHLWTEFARAKTQTWRIEAELGGKASWTPSEKQLQELRELPVPSSVIAQILSFESDKLAMSQAVVQKDKASLNRLIAQSGEQSALINEQLEKTKQGTQLAMAELARAQNLFERGLTPAQKVAEERRLTLLSQTQHLLTTERLGQVKKDREEFVRKLEVVDEQRRAGLSQELQDANMRLASAKHGSRPSTRSSPLPVF